MNDQFKEIAGLIGDPVRATVMWTLLDGKAFTATELAIAADTSPQNISMHLAKLVQAGLLVVESQGRHRYYKFARKDIAYAIEAMANLIPPVADKNQKENKNHSALQQCRTCYDHLAGKVGVAVTNSLLDQKIIMEAGNNFEISEMGCNWFSALAIDIKELQHLRRSFLRPCLDWSERRHHMAGSLAAALLDHMLLNDWLRRTENSRVMVITSKGRLGFENYFGVDI